MKDMLPSTVNVKTIVVDRRLAQLDAFQAAYPEARVSFCLFHVLVGMRRHCGSLPVSVERSGKRTPQRMRNFVFTSTKKTSIGSRWH